MSNSVRAVDVDAFFTTIRWLTVIARMSSGPLFDVSTTTTTRGAAPRMARPVAIVSPRLVPGAAGITSTAIVGTVSSTVFLTVLLAGFFAAFTLVLAVFGVSAVLSAFGFFTFFFAVRASLTDRLFATVALLPGCRLCGPLVDQLL